MDLLTLIFLRLPSRKLMQFKCVSKSWLCLINSFPPPSGLFVQGHSWPFPLGSSDPVFYFPLPDEYKDIRNLPTFCNYLFGGCGGDIRCHCKGSRCIRILDSSHGLLLCCSRYLGQDEREHYIYNPTTNQLATLPRPTDQSCFCSLSMALAFCPSNSPHYKVIACAKIPQSDESPVQLRQFEIYSSETKSWRVSGQPFLRPDGISFMNGVYCNGSVYWICKWESEAESADCLFFNLNEERLEKFPKPPIPFNSDLRRRSYFGKSEDHLHFIEVSLDATSLHVYELKCDHSEWFVKYQVDLAQLSKAYPQMINDLHVKKKYKVAVLSLVRRERFMGDDTFLVLDILGKVIRYNLVNRNFEEMFDRKVLDVDLRSGDLRVWQYVECHRSV